MNNQSMNGEVELKNVTVQAQTAAHLFKLKQIESTIDALNKVIADSVSKGVRHHIYLFIHSFICLFV
jgi:hypothetical protein